MKRLVPILLLLLPAVLFAQSPRDQDLSRLKKLGLTDAQAAQVIDIQSKARTTVRQDVVQLRLLHAQMEKALLPASPNMQEVNGYIAQIGQTHADLMKAVVGARAQLRQLMGEDTYALFSRMTGHGQRLSGTSAPQQPDRVPDPMMGGPGGSSPSMMEGNGSSMGGMSGTGGMSGMGGTGGMGPMGDMMGESGSMMGGLDSMMSGGSTEDWY